MENNFVDALKDFEELKRVKHNMAQDSFWNPYNSNYDFLNAFKNFIENDKSLEMHKKDGVINDIAPKRIIYKYNIEESNIIKEHIEEVLDVQIQNDVIVAWVLINPLFPMKSVQIDLIGTGWSYGDRHSKYLRTLQDGEFVWHVFVRENPLDNEDN